MKRLFLALSILLVGLLAVKAIRIPAKIASATVGQYTSAFDIPSLLDPFEKRPKLKHGEKWVVHLRLIGPVDEDSRTALVTALDKANNSGADVILLEINTGGGSVVEGFTISRAIEMSAVPVQCVVDGDAASMGFYILQSCDTRMMTKRSLLMVHEPSIGNVHGQPDEMRLWTNRVVKLAAAMASHESARLKLTLEQFKEKIAHGEEWWIEWDEALKVGAVDAVVDSVKNTISAYRHGKKPGCH